MKVLKIFVIAVFVLIVLAFVGTYIFVKNFDINKHKDTLALEIGKQLGRNVEIASMDLNVSITKGIYAEVRGLTISEDAVFGKGHFATLGAAQLNVDVMAYLSKREIVISKIIIDALNVNIIRDQIGSINVQKIGPVPSDKVNTAAASSPATAIASSSAPAIPDFSVRTITISNGTILYKDKGQNPPMQIPISHVDITITDFSLSKPFAFDGKLALFGGEKNVDVSGQASISVADQSVKITSFVTEVYLAKLKIADLVNAVPALAPMGLKENLEGKVTIEIPSLSAGASGLGSLVLNGKLQGGKIVTALLPVPIEKVSADFSANAKDFSANQFSLQLRTGIVSGKAMITDYLLSQGLVLDVKVKEMPLASLVSGLPEGMTFGGALEADAHITGEGLADPNKFLNSLNGSGKFDVKDGKLENFNVLKVILSRIEFIPGLATIVETNMPQQYKESFVRNDTIFQKINSSLQITDGVFNMPDMQVVSDLFEADMKISANSKLVGTVAGQVKLPADLSEYLASKTQPLGYLRNSEGRIVMPLTSYEGPLTSLKIFPDVKSLGKAALEGEGRNQVNKLLNKVLKTDGTLSTGTEEGAQPDQIINGVLDKIFK